MEKTNKSFLNYSASDYSLAKNKNKPDENYDSGIEDDPEISEHNEKNNDGEFERTAVIIEFKLS